MKQEHKKAIAIIRARLGVKRLDPRRLFLVDDGGYRWSGVRADLNAKTASMLAFDHREGTRPDLVSRGEREEADLRWGADWYSHACAGIASIASECGSGAIIFDALPED